MEHIKFGPAIHSVTLTKKQSFCRLGTIHYNSGSVSKLDLEHIAMFLSPLPVCLCMYCVSKLIYVLVDGSCENDRNFKLLYLEEVSNHRPSPVVREMFDTRLVPDPFVRGKICENRQDQDKGCQLK